MNEWDTFTAKVISAICNVETTTIEEQIMKLTILRYLYLSLLSEETFNNNIKILNENNKEPKI